jgi:hypothetical protein
MERQNAEQRAHGPTGESARVRRLRERFDALKQAILELDFFLRGNLVKVWVRCGSERCACATDPDRRHGPYVQWTRKVKGKTVSVRVRPEQLARYEQWIASARRLDSLIDEMQRLSLAAAEQILQPPKKKPPRGPRRTP